MSLLVNLIYMLIRDVTKTSSAHFTFMQTKKNVKRSFCLRSDLTGPFQKLFSPWVSINRLESFDLSLSQNNSTSISWRSYRACFGNGFRRNEH